MTTTAKTNQLLHLVIGWWLLPVILLSGCTYDTAPLHSAIRKDNTKTALKCIAKGKHINKRDSVMHQETLGKAPLYCATERGQHDVVAALLEAGADVHMEEEREGKLSIHAAAMNGHTRITRLLIKHGAKVNARDDYGRLPLVFAAASGHAQTVEVLLDHGAAVNTRDSSGLLAVTAASRHGHLDVVRKLIKAGADVNARGDTGWTPLMMAAGKGDIACVKLLLGNGAAPSARSADCNWTALHFAAYYEHVAIVDHFIDSGLRVQPISATERDCYATAVSYKLLARHHEGNSDTQKAIQCYTIAEKHYEKAFTAFQQRRREIGDKIASARLAALGRFAGALAFSAVAASAMPSIDAGSTSYHTVFVPTGSPTADTTNLSSLSKDCDRRIKESKRCAVACRRIIEGYRSHGSIRNGDKSMKEARRTLGLL